MKMCGCLSATLTRVGEALEVTAQRIGTAPRLSVSRLGTPLCASFGLVCTVEEDAKYLRVEPEYIWLMEGNDYTEDVLVWSNVEWIANTTI